MKYTTKTKEITNMSKKTLSLTLVLALVLTLGIFAVPALAATTLQPPSGNIDSRLVGVWADFHHQYFVFYDNGSFEYTDRMGWVYKGEYSTYGGRVNFTRISYYQMTMNGGHGAIRNRIDLVSDYAFKTYDNRSGVTYLQIFEPGRNRDIADFKFGTNISPGEFFRR